MTTLGLPMEVTLSRAHVTYILDCRAAGLAPKTLRGYDDGLRAFINYTGDITVHALEPDHVRRYIASLASKPGKYEQTFSTHSIMKHYQIIRTWIRWMYAQKIIAERIIDHVRPPRLSEQLPSILTDEEVDAIFNLLREENRFRDIVIFELFLDTGIRLEEMSQLQLGDLNIEGSWIRVAGKGDVEGIVPIGHQVARDLYQYIHMYRQPMHENEPALWINRHGLPFGYEGLSKMVFRTLDQCRIQTGKRSAHVLRHTAATTLLRNGANREVVRKVLRHKDGRVTDRYLHLIDKDVMEAHQRASPVDALRRRRRDRR